MRKYILTYGLISGIVLALFMAISISMSHKNNSLDLGTSMIIGYAAMVLVSGACMSLAVLRRDKSGAQVSYLKSMLMCLGIGGVTALLYLIGWAITYKFFMPDFAERFIKSMEESYKAGKLSQADLEEFKKNFSNYDNPVVFSLYTLMEIAPVALGLSFIVPIISVFAKRKKQD